MSPELKRSRGRPRTDHPRGNGEPIRIEPEVAQQARLVAVYRKVKVGRYLSDLVRAQVARDLAAAQKGGA